MSSGRHQAHARRCLAGGILLAALAGAQVTTYETEAAYLAALSGLGQATFTEGFEEDGVFGPARHPLAVASVSSQGVIWTSNHADALTKPGQISTVDTAAHSGSYGVFSLPHGDSDVTVPTGFMRDGLIGTRVMGGTELYGVGFWITGLPGSRVRLILDGNESNTIEVGSVDGSYRFFGVTVPGGFRKFEVRETEGKLEDQKYIFADDFTFAYKPGETGTAIAVSSASYAGSPLAAGSVAALFGDRLAASTAVTPSENLPTNLAETEVRIRDSAEIERLALLYFVSPSQVNFVVPAESASGAATLSVASGGQVVATGSFQIAAVAPGLFAANMDGGGPAAAWVIRRAPGSPDTYQLTCQCGLAPGSCVTSPIDLGGVTDQYFLELFGTGIGGRTSQAAVSVAVGGTDVEVVYAGAQGFYRGLDLVNVRLPQTLGRGVLDVTLTVDGLPANTVRIEIK